MIKHNISNSVISPFNPIVALHPYIRKAVNEYFIEPILNVFFAHRGGIEYFEPLDNDKLTTEIEFNDNANDESYVKTYIYKEIISQIEKDLNGKILFKPKYAISFDEDLSPFVNPNFYNYGKLQGYYPYKVIFKDDRKIEKPIRFGTLRLGNEPILYVIFIDFQEVTRFIKTIPVQKNNSVNEKIFTETQEEIKLRLFDNLIRTNQIKRNLETDITRKEELNQEINRLRYFREEQMQGDSGEFRVNLSWQTTDDLDLHIETPNGVIKHDNKIVEYQGIIGELDVDKNAGSDLVSNPQENIKWNGLPVGKYTISVNLYKNREKNKVPFTLTTISNTGEGMVLTSFVEVGENQKRVIASFEYQGGKLEFKNLVDMVNF